MREQIVGTEHRMRARARSVRAQWFLLGALSAIVVMLAMLRCAFG